MNSIIRKRRDGLTVLEVLFAIGIVLVGLVGIGLMVPFAARQANESYAISQAIASGESAVALANSQAVIRPTPEKPWQIIDDEYTTFGDTNKTLYSSFYELYNNNSGRHPLNPPLSPSDPKYLNDLYTRNLDLLNFSGAGSIPVRQEIAWQAVNRTLGTCFYLDPSFWGTQSIGNKVMQNAWAPFRRSRFPYYTDSFGPSTPRPLRISLHDSNHVGANGGWMKPSVARNTVSGGGGDIVSVKKESNSQIPHHRSFVVVGNNADVIQGSASPNAPIWSALVAPIESTQIFSRNELPDPTGHDVVTYGREIWNFGLPFFPEAYDLSIVVQRKRNLNEIYAGSAITPAEVEQERIFSGSWDAAIDEPHNSGSFTITLQQPAQVSGLMEAKIKTGDWLMLSRNVLTFYRLNAASPPAWAAVRQKHKWYRVISVPSSDVFPLDIRISGNAWTWTTDEIQSSARVGLSLGSLGDPTTPYYVQTSATLIPNVIHVYERTFSSSN